LEFTGYKIAIANWRRGDGGGGTSLYQLRSKILNDLSHFGPSTKTVRITLATVYSYPMSAVVCILLKPSRASCGRRLCGLFFCGSRLISHFDERRCKSFTLDFFWRVIIFRCMLLVGFIR